MKTLILIASLSMALAACHDDPGSAPGHIQAPELSGGGAAVALTLFVGGIILIAKRRG